MKFSRKKRYLPILILIVITVITISIVIIRVNNQQNQQTLEFREIEFTKGRGYEFKKGEPNRLIIVLEGGGFSSVMPYRMSGNRFFELFLYSSAIYDRYTIFIPEKFNREAGWDYIANMEERENYTIDNLIINYYEVITEYLSMNNFETIIIAGYSEGAAILPVLYLYFDNPNIKYLISYAGGGLSYYERTQISLAKLYADEYPFSLLYENSRNGWRGIYENVINYWKTEPFPDSTRNVTGVVDRQVTFKYLNSLIHLKPIQYYEDIFIPVLFLHGEWDMRVDVDSTRYVEANLPQKPFSYIYYPEQLHFPRRETEADEIHRDIAAWLLKVDP